MSGLPASGKTTLGRTLAKLLNFKFIDKDETLEFLLSEQANYTSELRQRLSRESDLIFREQAMQGENAVLTSFWRAPNNQSTAGTPSDWLPSVSSDIIEIVCHCDIHIAVTRFLTRRRHPGHMDHLQDKSTLRNQFESLLTSWPLGFGKIIEVDTSMAVSAPMILNRVREFWPVI